MREGRKSVGPPATSLTKRNVKQISFTLIFCEVVVLTIIASEKLDYMIITNERLVFLPKRTYARKSSGS